MSNAVVEMLYSEIVTEVRLSAIEDAIVGLNMPDLTIATVASGVRLTGATVNELRDVYRRAQVEANTPEREVCDDVR